MTWLIDVAGYCFFVALLTVGCIAVDHFENPTGRSPARLRPGRRGARSYDCRTSRLSGPRNHFR